MVMQYTNTKLRKQEDITAPEVLCYNVYMWTSLLLLAGPMSLTVYLSDAETVKLLELVQTSPVLSTRMNLGLHVVYKKGVCSTKQKRMSKCAQIYLCNL